MLFLIANAHKETARLEEYRVHDQTTHTFVAIDKRMNDLFGEILVVDVKLTDDV